MPKKRIYLILRHDLKILLFVYLIDWHIIYLTKTFGSL